jgi:hypothetical protein
MTTNDSFLTPAEKAELHVLAENETAIMALKKLLLHSVYYQGTLRAGEEPNPTLNFALALTAGEGAKDSNEHIGMRLRARWEGVNFVEAGFNDLASYKTKISSGNKKPNQGR